MSVSTHLLIYIGTPSLTLATFAWRLSRAVLLYRAGSTALKKGTDDPQGKAGLEIVEELSREAESSFRAILGRRSDDNQP